MEKLPTSHYSKTSRFTDNGEATIQVLKKWLSYREQALLGRTLSVDEVSYFGQVVRRIAALLLLGPELDANYRRIKENTFAWPR